MIAKVALESIQRLRAGQRSLRADDYNAILDTLTGISRDWNVPTEPQAVFVRLITAEPFDDNPYRWYYTAQRGAFREDGEWVDGDGNPITGITNSYEALNPAGGGWTGTGLNTELLSEQGLRLAPVGALEETEGDHTVVVALYESRLICEPNTCIPDE